ncbi:inositol monophosphatase [Candidatus Microgenomates bacterium]|nr:inositol monophosphatase [Candidatus Microgenomates bacterium]
MKNDKAFEIAKQAARQAGEFIKSRFLNLKPEEVFKKSKHDLVTSVDRGAEKIILNLITNNFPNHAILSEEAGKKEKKSDYLWVIDPLDGTTNFFIGNPLFAVSIALFYKKEVVLSVIHIPVTKQTFSAQKNKGAYLNKTKLSVSHKTELDGACLAYCFPPKKNGMQWIAKIFPKLVEKASLMRQFGSASWEVCQVASGKLDGFFLPYVSSWDVAGGALLVQEAGGKVTNFQGKPWTLNDQFFLATNGKIHQELLGILKNSHTQT